MLDAPPGPEQQLNIARDRIAFLEAELRRQRSRSELFRIVFDQTPNIAMVVDRNAQVIDINRAGQQFTGKPREQILNLLSGNVIRCLNALAGEGCGRNTACSNCPIRCRVTRTFDSGEPIHLEEGRLLVQRQSDEQPLDFLISTVPVRIDGSDLVLVTLVDITERKRLEAERERIFNLSQDLICVVEFDGCFRRLNPAWEQCLGWSVERLLGSHWLEFVHAEDRPATEEAEEQLRAGERLTGFVNRYRCRDGNWRWLSWNIVPDQHDGCIFAVARDVTEQQHIAAELHRLATTDSLTGLLNRRSFLERANAELTRYHRYSQSFAVMMLDLDRFKSINDSHGHAAGDAVLRTLGDRLRDMLRGSDFCGRLGGEEFALLLPSASHATARSLAERLAAALRQQPVTVADTAIHFTASIGFTIVRPDDQRLEALLSRADHALYLAKAAGRDCVRSD